MTIWRVVAVYIYGIQTTSGVEDGRWGAVRINMAIEEHQVPPAGRHRLSISISICVLHSAGFEARSSVRIQMSVSVGLTLQLHRCVALGRLGCCTACTICKSRGSSFLFKPA